MGAMGHVAETDSEQPLKGDVDEPFMRSMAALSAQLAARRVAEPLPALETPERSRFLRRGDEDGNRHGILWALALLLCAVTASGVYFLSGKSDTASAPAPAPMAISAQAPPAEQPPAPRPPPVEPRAAARPEPPPPPAAAQPSPPAVATVPPSNEPATLTRYEIVEVQTRLKELGIGPALALDGVAGRQTQTAVRRYEEANGLPPTGTVNRSLLNRLRQETKAP